MRNYIDAVDYMYVWWLFTVHQQVWNTYVPNVHGTNYVERDAAWLGCTVVTEGEQYDFDLIIPSYLMS